MWQIGISYNLEVVANRLKDTRMIHYLGPPFPRSSTSGAPHQLNATKYGTMITQVKVASMAAIVVAREAAEVGNKA